ncbi:MAG: DUF4062 domain-containing protein [Pseudomonadota bacterium]
MSGSNPRKYDGVMISSTFEDLEEHRAQLIRALKRQQLFPAAMEHATLNAGYDLVSSSLQMVRESSAYIGLIGHRYGNVPDTDNPEGVSLTRLEFEEAQKLGRPTLIFIMGCDYDIKQRDLETDPDKLDKLRDFKERAKQGRIYEEFNNPEEFTEKAIHAVADLRRLLDAELTGAENDDRQPLQTDESDRIPDEYSTPAPKNADAANGDVNSRVCALRISLSEIHPALLRNRGKLAEDLLQTSPGSIEDDLIGSLLATVDALKRRKRAVEAICAFSPNPPRSIASTEDFAAALLTDHVLKYQEMGLLKWFIRETSRVEPGSGTGTGNEQRVWAEIADRYLNQGSPEYQPDLQALVHSAIRSALEDSPNRLYPFFQLLWPIVSDLPEVIDKFVEFLKETKHELGDAVRPALLEKLNVLEGQGERLARSDDSTQFNPDLIQVPADENFGYSFEAMRTPITNLQYRFLCGNDRDEALGLNNPYLLGPWEWKDGGKDRYPLVAAEIGAILESCEYTAAKPDHVWRVPTVAEWLRLAGCEDNPYPWGTDAPEEDHANLNFGGALRIRSVGSYPRGRSPHGADDCCGNIHEIAWLHRRQLIPHDSRLLGGSFLTRSEQSHSSCRRLRILSKRDPDPRQNVGLRLVRVPQSAVDQRWEVVEKLSETLDSES